jgi:ATP-dependent RNA/DNA helicase IGHMBP2
VPQDLTKLADALERERRALQEEDAKLRALPLPDRAALGYTLYPLDLMTVEHRSRGRVNVLLRGRDLHDGISPGDPVVLAPVGRPDVGITGRCEGHDEGTIELRLDEAPEGKGPWAVSRRLDLGILDLQVAALQRAENTWSPLKNLLLGFEKPYRPDPLDHPALRRLNPSQRIAAATALGATEIGLVHGPPGTGKTETLVAILEALREMGDQPWALAESNAAVDHLSLRAAARGLDVVRLGVSARVGTPARHLTLEHRILNGARAPVLHGLIREHTRATGPRLAEIDTAIREQWHAAKTEILGSADVIAMTLGTLHTRGRELVSPKTAVVDEATQVWEPALWLAATRVKRLILAGDPNQLGPVVKSRNPLLERSLLARLVEEGFFFPMLTEQYRMVPAIQALVNPTYGGALTVATEAQLDPTPLVPSRWAEPLVRFVDTAGLGFDEERDGLGSYHNPGELGLVARIVGELLTAGVRPEQLGIVTPYNAQLARVRALFPNIEAGSVNAFQGREKDAIVATFVRSNADQELGFVSDPRRLNVTVSRARRLFVGIGDAATLGASAELQRVIDGIAEAGGYTSAWELEE